MLGTYDHTMVNISVQGIALTHFNGDVVISKEGDDWDVTEGSNGCVQRSKMVRKLYTVTLPFMQTSPQLSKLEALRVADASTAHTCFSASAGFSPWATPPRDAPAEREPSRSASRRKPLLKEPKRWSQ